MIEIHPTQKEIDEAIDRLARTADGAALYVHLQRRVMAISAADSDGALRLDQGERTFASKLIALMAQGIFESGGRTDSSSSTGGASRTEQPFVVPRAEPVSIGSRAARSAARARAIDAIDIGGAPRDTAGKA